MKKTIKNTTDFFTLYRSSQFRKFLLSGSIAGVMAFGFASMIHGGIDTRGLMASVANITEAPTLDANLIMRQQGNTLSIIFGAKAENVDRIDFTLLSDPSRFHSLDSIDKQVAIISQPEMGTYHISINMQGKNIAPGTQIAELLAGIDVGIPIALTDTEFVSGGQRYNMTSKVE